MDDSGHLDDQNGLEYNHNLIVEEDIELDNEHYTPDITKPTIENILGDWIGENQTLPHRVGDDLIRKS